VETGRNPHMLGTNPMRVSVLSGLFVSVPASKRPAPHIGCRSRCRVRPPSLFLKKKVERQRPSEPTPVSSKPRTLLFRGSMGTIAEIPAGRPNRMGCNNLGTGLLSTFLQKREAAGEPQRKIRPGCFVLASFTSSEVENLSSSWRLSFF